MLGQVKTEEKSNEITAIPRLLDLLHLKGCLKTSTESRHCISSRPNLPATTALQSSRSHWGIENELHWVLDMAYRKDDCRIRVDNAAENFSVVRHLSLNLLKSVKGNKVGIKTRRLRAGWDHAFLIRVLAASPVAG